MSRPVLRRLAWPAAVLLAAAVVSCGRVGDPIAPGKTLLTAPEEPRLGGQGGAILFTWDKPGKTLAGSRAEPAGYLVERDVWTGDRSACPDCPAESGVAARLDVEERKARGETATSWRDESVRPGWTYRYRVRAVDDRGRAGEPSRAVAMVWRPVGVPTVIVAGADRAAVVRYAPPDIPAGARHEGLRAYGANGALLSTFPPNLSEGRLENLENGRPATIAFRWAAALPDETLVESEAAVVTFVPEDREPPPPPDQFVAFPESDGVRLLWMPARGEPYREVIIERALPEGEFAELARVSGTDTLYLDRTAESGVVYRYRCAVVDEAGNRSDFTSPISGSLLVPRVREERLP
jgi:hypothetical protein